MTPVWRIRHLAYAAVAVASVAAGVMLTATPSSGLEQAALTISEGESFSRQYLTVPGNNPANQAYDPQTCKLAPYCDTVRLTIRPPSDPDTGYFVRIQLSWKTRAETDVPTQGEMTNNDMDMFVFRTPYDPTKGNDEQEVATGATGAQPETAYVSPAGDYDIVIVNFIGVNEEGYKLTLTYVSETVFTPPELLDDFRPQEDVTVDDTSGTAVPSAPVAPLVDAPLAAAAAPPAVFLGGGAFDDPFGLTTPIAGISAAAQRLLAGPQDGPPPPPGPVSTLSVVLWLAIVPMAVLGSGGWVLSRRRGKLFGG